MDNVNRTIRKINIAMAVAIVWCLIFIALLFRGPGSLDAYTVLNIMAWGGLAVLVGLIIAKWWILVRIPESDDDY